MKRNLFFLWLLASTATSVSAQDSLVLRKISFATTITYRDGKEQDGFLQQIGDSSVALTSKSVRFGALPLEGASTRQVSFADINSMVIRRKNSGARGALFGALTGIIIGAAAGLISGDTPQPQPKPGQFNFQMHFGPQTGAEKAAVYGVAGGIVGAALGAIIGSLVRKTFTIGGHKQDFDIMKENVLDRAYAKP